ncbi:hypothetical protein Pyn_18689 [Prunus yedoensis var. nudiflora]|uniref:Uncharacterized protein n=1 Tax=Prunus yedoensis var. nudiflora TaxID=2094558 RepID=A0A314XZR5_PRUYE|nr:hypothetical protein Pyn_18689 [Prunus yedoensis var. nudiflora]
MWPGTSHPTRDWAPSTHNRILNTRAPVTSPTRVDYPAKGLQNTPPKVPEFRHIQVSISELPYLSIQVLGRGNNPTSDHLAEPHGGISNKHVTRDEPSNRGLSSPTRTTESSILMRL